MNFRKLLPILSVCVALMAFPPAVGAQSAGDDQYVDPLNGTTNGGSGSGGSTGNPVGDGEADVAGSAEADVSALPAELARTGAELPVLAGLGALLLAGGLGLRRISGERR